jgi:4-hydroxy-2-oxoheptanedioate aldolase
METPVNVFKQALRARKRQIGLWVGLTSPYSAEICAGAGFDWLLLDAEHSPNDIGSLLAQLQAVAPYSSHPVVRVPAGEPAVMQQVLDLGAQTLLVPMVESAEQAIALAKAMRYPPGGVRGVGTALSRAARWSRIGAYLQTADEQMCFLVQIETARGLEKLEEIARVEGVDGVFVGPADLAASLGFRGQTDRPEVQYAIEAAVGRIQECGKAAGVLFTQENLVRRYLELGCTFVAVGIDTLLLARATQLLAEAYAD